MVGGIADLGEQRQDLADTHPGLPHKLRDRHPLHQLHGHKGPGHPALLPHPRLVHRRDARMRQTPEHLALELHAAHARLRQALRTKQFQSHATRGPFLLGLVDHPHAARPEPADDPVARDQLGIPPDALRQHLGRRHAGPALQPVGCGLVGPQHRFHGRPQRRIPGTGFIEVGRPLLRLEHHGPREQVLHSPKEVAVGHAGSLSDPARSGG